MCPRIMEYFWIKYIAEREVNNDIIIHFQKIANAKYKNDIG